MKPCVILKNFRVSTKRWLAPNEFRWRKVEQLIPVTNCCLTTTMIFKILKGIKQSGPNAASLNGWIFRYIKSRLRYRTIYLYRSSIYQSLIFSKRLVCKHLSNCYLRSFYIFVPFLHLSKPYLYIKMSFDKHQNYFCVLFWLLFNICRRAEFIKKNLSKKQLLNRMFLL